MSNNTIQFLELGLTILIAAATIWIAFAANKISKRQLRMDLEKQKLEWCRACLQEMSKAISLAAHTATEIPETDFKLRRREIRGKIIALKNEGELFLAPSSGDADDVPCLNALKRCFQAMNGTRFGPPTQKFSQARKQVGKELLEALDDFRSTMRAGFGNVWSEHG